MTETTLLTAAELSRHYGTQNVVDSISFHVNKGEVLGFLGPNGAGKSTTMQMLTGNLAPHHGDVDINGYNLFTQSLLAKQHIGYLPEQPPLYKSLTVSEFLRFSSQLNQIAKSKQTTAINRVIERCGLGDMSHRLIGNLSKGYQQRVGIAQAIIHNPAVVILDESTSGLDPIQIRQIRQLIRDVADEHSVILSTHILPEVQTLCDRVQIMHHGKLLFTGSVTDLTQQHSLEDAFMNIIQTEGAS